MSEAEGVIKYELSFQQTDLPDVDISLINCWRELLVQLDLVGQHPGRYGGLGFGNLSMRTPDGFLITGTQTGGIQQLSLSDYALVTSWHLEDNIIEAKGQVRPSSEALTHAAIYTNCAQANFVFHCHSPRIWQVAGNIGLMITDATVPYGTPAMAREVALKLRERGSPAIMAMGGHEDGIVAWGEDADAAGLLLVQCLVRATRCH
ncbi:MAG: class II aldolase/adducin family protein [Pseudomonadales bacterium]